MSFIDTIIEREDGFKRIAEETKESNTHVILWGKGKRAKFFYDAMTKYGFKPDVVAVEKEYLKQDMFEDYKVIDLESALTMFDKVDVVVAYGAWDENDKSEWGFGKWRNTTEKRLRAMDAKGRIRNVIWQDAFSNEHGIWSYDFVKKNNDKFNETYNWLEDEESKKIMSAFVNQRISGNFSYLEPFFRENVYFDCPGFNMQEGEVVVDGGAYTGDTILSLFDFAKNNNTSIEKVYAFEPDRININQMQNNGVSQNPKVQLLPFGLWKEKNTLKFDERGTAGSTISNQGEVTVEVNSIDNILDGNRATFIKMDIEGAELDALHGAVKTIQKFYPRMAICIYHRPEDLFTIPQYIKEILPEYKLYLRYHSTMAMDVVLYAAI